MLAIVTLAFAGAAFAQNSSTVTGVHATSRVIAPITITKCADLNFGNVLAASTAGTVTISNNIGSPYDGAATQTYSNPNMKPGNQTGAWSNACFTVGGECGFSYNESHPSTLTVTNGASCVGPGCVNTMTVTLSSIDVTGGTQWVGTDDGDLPGDTADCAEGETNRFHIGGTLSVGPTNGTATQNVGTYSGTWAETISY